MAEDTAGAGISTVTWITTTVALTTATAGAATEEEGRGLLMKGAGHLGRGQEVARCRNPRQVLGPLPTKFSLINSLIVSQNWSN